MTCICACQNEYVQVLDAEPGSIFMCLCSWQQNNDWGLVKKLGMGTMVGLFGNVEAAYSCACVSGNKIMIGDWSRSWGWGLWWDYLRKLSLV